MSAKSIQSALIALGYDLGAGGADGDVGPATKAAITKYRADNGMPAGGIDQSLRDALQRSLAAKSATAKVSDTMLTPARIAIGVLVTLGLVWWLSP
jgi:peptidoglycan hydrolase-like protein with peptidoglycan-binding domain